MICLTKKFVSGTLTICKYPYIHASLVPAYGALRPWD